MNVYENITIFDASLSDEAAQESIQKVKDTITGAGGEVLKVEIWGRRKLSYEIKKHARGLYVLFVFKSPSTAIRNLEELSKVYDPIVKSLVVKLDKKQMQHVLNSLIEAAAPAVAPVAPAEASTEGKEGV